MVNYKQSRAGQILLMAQVSPKQLIYIDHVIQLILQFLDIYRLQRGSQADSYIIYTYAMISSNRNNSYALTVDTRQCKLQYTIYDKDNSHKYEWCFSCHNDTFAIRWCGDSNTSGKDFVFYLDNDKLKLTSYPADTPLQPEHYISYFPST